GDQWRRPRADRHPGPDRASVAALDRLPDAARRRVLRLLGPGAEQLRQPLLRARGSGPDPGGLRAVRLALGGALMDPAALAGLCLLLARGQAAGPPPAGVSCPPLAVSPMALRPPMDGTRLAVQLDAPSARDGI